MTQSISVALEVVPELRDQPRVRCDSDMTAPRRPCADWAVAMDDSLNGAAVSHEIDQALFNQLHYGDWLHLEITPKLRCVRSTHLVPAPRLA